MLGHHPNDAFPELEALTAARDFGAVLKLGAPLLTMPCSAGELALIRFYLGQAHCRLVEPREALMLLPRAREHFERHQDEQLAVEPPDWEASAWGLLEDPRALAMEDEALDRCRKLKPRQQQLAARILGPLATLLVVTPSAARAVAHS